MAGARRERDTLVAIRTTQEIKAALKEVTAMMGEELGSRITQAQAIEILISEALRVRMVRE